MALAVSIRYDFIDDKGKSSHTKIRVPNGFSLSDYAEFATLMGNIISSLCDGRITKIGICVGVDLSGATIKAVATAVSDVAQKAYAQFATAAQGFRSRMKIPALDETLVIAGSDAIDQANANVTTFISAMENGLAVTGPATISPCDDRENDITDTTTLRELFRKT